MFVVNARTTPIAAVETSNRSPAKSVSVLNWGSPLTRSPTGEISRRCSGRQFQRVAERAIEIGREPLVPNPLPQKIGPGELAKRRGLLGEAARAAKRPGKTAKGIVGE